MKSLLRLAALLPVLTVSDLGAAEVLAGPIPAQVVRVVDGDTVVVRARIWLGQDVETLVRIAAIDTPEKHGKCDSERLAAQAAQAWLEGRVAGGEVTLRDVAYEKYGGRVLARISGADGADLAQGLVAAGLARPYGGGKKQSWCS